jgi:hypothetical protein
MILSIVNNPIFEYSRLGLFKGGYGGNLLGEFIVNFSDVISLIGYTLLIVFAILLIIKNVLEYIIK